MGTPTTTSEYAFSGSLCRIHEFKTAEGLHRYCLTVFTLSDYKHLHFPHDEYEKLINKLSAHLSTQAIFPTATASNSVACSIEQLPFDGDLKIHFGQHRLTIGPVTAFGLVKFSPFTNTVKRKFACESKWDICTCRKCSVFSRLIDFEASAQRLFDHRKLENVIL